MPSDLHPIFPCKDLLTPPDLDGPVHYFASTQMAVTRSIRGKSRILCVRRSYRQYQQHKTARRVRTREHNYKITNELVNLMREASCLNSVNTESNSLSRDLSSFMRVNFCSQLSDIKRLARTLTATVLPSKLPSNTSAKEPWPILLTSCRLSIST